MERRYQLKRGSLAIESEYSEHGRFYLESLRKLRSDLFKRGRIVDMLQARPDLMPTGHVYRLNGETIGQPVDIPRGSLNY